MFQDVLRQPTEIEFTRSNVRLALMDLRYDREVKLRQKEVDCIERGLMEHNIRQKNCGKGSDF